MKICIPVKENLGLESMPYNHFGSAPFFIIYDTEKKDYKAIENHDLNHAHGMCQPVKALGNEEVHAVLVGGIGAGAINKLNNQGIKVYKIMPANAKENIELLEKGELVEFTAEFACTHHDCHH